MNTQDIIRLWRPTAHYGRLLTEGRNRPAPSIGSPTLIWHLAIWRKRPQYNRNSTEENAKAYLNQNREFFQEISQFLKHLQALGLTPAGGAPQDVALERIPVPGAQNDGSDKFQIFETFLPQSMNFELWWLEGADNKNPNRRLQDDAPQTEKDGAIRVFVQFQSFHDHVTCTFYMDIAQNFDGSQILDADELATRGSRKGKLANILHIIRKASLGQIRSSAINMPTRVATDDHRIPKDLRVDPSAELGSAVDYIYGGIWEEFQGAFQFSLPGAKSDIFEHGVVFYNIRGLLMSHQGLETPEDKQRRDRIEELKALNKIAPPSSTGGSKARDWKPSERAAGDTLGPVDLFDRANSEAEVVLRSFGPFLEAMSPNAHGRDWVGCAIVDWRGIFASPLGSRAEVSRDGAGNPLKEGTTSHWSERFLVLSKGEPNKEQMGRMIERITSLETMRTFALKNLGLIQNCYHYLGVLTAELDNILKYWNERRQILRTELGEGNEGDFRDPKLYVRYVRGRKAEILRLYDRGWWGRVKAWFKGPFHESPPPEREQMERFYYDCLSKLNEGIERKLIEISADMESMGPKGSGYVLQDIQQSTYFIDEFNRMVETLEVRNLHGWIDYRRFADRGMRPTFNMIRNTGERLRGAQERIKALTDVIQVSGLIVQSDATRRNTDALRSIARDFHRLNGWRFWRLGFLFALAGFLLKHYFNYLVVYIPFLKSYLPL